MDTFLNAPAVVAMGGTALADNPAIVTIATDTYFNGSIAWPENDAIRTGEGLVFHHPLTLTTQDFQIFADIAAQNGWSLTSYEGGTHFAAGGGWSEDLLDFYMTLDRAQHGRDIIGDFDVMQDILVLRGLGLSAADASAAAQTNADGDVVPTLDALGIAITRKGVNADAFAEANIIL